MANQFALPELIKRQQHRVNDAHSSFTDMYRSFLKYRKRRFQSIFSTLSTMDIL